MTKVTTSPTWRQRLNYLGQRMKRQKDVGRNDTKTELRRCLSTFHLIVLGVGATIGVGIYVLLGVIAKENAGPSSILCFLLASFVTMLNAMVFAEFATYVPQTGATYVYMYKSFGEFPAFLGGWILVVGGILSGAVGARAWSGMVDSFFNHTIQAKTIELTGEIQWGLPFAESLDFVAFTFELVVLVIVSCNVLCSSIINTILGVLTTSVLIFVFIAGVAYGDVDNFLNPLNGGFLAFGLAGVVKGTSMALYATNGFEVICMSSEEAKDPAKSVPRGIIGELLIVATVYVAANIGILFLCPYWLLDLRAPLPSAFAYHGILWGKYIVTIGPLFGITNLQMLNLYGGSRLLYRMANDGLFFPIFLKVDKKMGVPRNSVIFQGALIAILSLLCDLSYIVRASVVLMLLLYVLMGTALIKLIIRERSIRDDQEVKSLPDKIEQPQGKEMKDFYDQEIVVSDEGDNNATMNGMHQRISLNFVTNGNDGAHNISPEEEDMDAARLLDSVPYLTSDLESQDLFPVENGDLEANRHTSDLQNHLNSNSNSDSWKTITGTELVDFSNDTIQEPGKALTKSANHTTGVAGNVNMNLSETAISASVDESGADVDKTVEEGEDSSDFETPIDKQLAKQEREHHWAKTWKQRLAASISPFCPGVLSINKVLLMHLVCVASIAVLLNQGWTDLTNHHVVAWLALGVLVSILVLLSLLIWAQCGRAKLPGFQTPLMPLVPTVSMLFSCTLLISTGDVAGIIETVVLVVLGTIIYVIIVLLSSDSETEVSHEKRKLLYNDTEGDADDEVDSDEL